MSAVVVVGGGIAGLVAAARVAAAGVEVTLLERSERLGGNVRTIPFAGRSLDVGAEMMITAQPAAVELCAELGLADDLVTPVAAPAHVAVRGRLRPLPDGLMSGLPGGVGDLLRSRILTPIGALRAGVDLVVPSRAREGDVAIGAIIRDRLGAQVLERLVDPLLGGIHGSRCDDLSAQALTPQALTALARGRGLVRGLRAAARTTEGPTFATLRHGLGTLTAALAETLVAAGADVRLSVSATTVRPGAGGAVSVLTEDGAELHADGCVVATPAPAAGRMLASASPVAAAELAGVHYSSAAVVALAYPLQALDGLPVGSGFVTAGDERGVVRACTWSSAKWRHLAGEPALLKAFVGRAGTQAAGDGELVEMVHADLARVLRLRARPVEARVERFAPAIPQYAVGHLARVARIEEALPDCIELAGAAYRGVGIPACVRSGQAAADRVLQRLGRPARAAIRG
jgi:oxygen-dependent protoporphyrinogen oxidase